LQGEIIFTAMQLNKSIKIFINYFLGPILFCWLAFSIYRHIVNQEHLEVAWVKIKSSFSSYKILYLLLAFFLVFVNWGIEAWKWKISVEKVYPVRFIQAFKAVLSGVSFSVTMPNRIGEYLGRIMYLPEGSRLKTISLTVVGSYAQLLVTLFMGIIGLVVLKDDLLGSFQWFIIWYEFLLYGLIVLVVLLTLFYFKVAGTVKLFKKWFRNQRYLYLVEALQFFNMQLLTRIMLLSLLRYFVFLVQYVLVFYLCEVQLDAALITWIMSVVFLAMALIPSIALLEIGLRGQISLKLMGLYTVNSLGVTITMLCIWLINLILPAIVGSLFILSIKVFNKKNEKT
jgi:hypothetical protein